MHRALHVLPNANSGLIKITNLILRTRVTCICRFLVRLGCPVHILGHSTTNHVVVRSRYLPSDQGAIHFVDRVNGPKVRLCGTSSGRISEIGAVQSEYRCDHEEEGQNR
jgi:hypothetical protein